MSCHSKVTLENMLEDVVNELDLSAEAIGKHGPLGTPPAELVRLVLAQKNEEIRMLKAGLVDVVGNTAMLRLLCDIVDKYVPDGVFREGDDDLFERYMEIKAQQI